MKVAGKLALNSIRLCATSRLELFHRLNAAAANGRMRGVLADVRFPMPAALTFLAAGFFNSSQWRDNGTHAGCSSRAWVISRL